MSYLIRKPQNCIFYKGNGIWDLMRIDTLTANPFQFDRCSRRSQSAKEEDILKTSPLIWKAKQKRNSKRSNASKQFQLNWTCEAENVVEIGCSGCKQVYSELILRAQKQNVHGKPLISGKSVAATKRPFYYNLRRTSTDYY